MLSLGTIKYSPLGKYASTERKGMISWSRYGGILHVYIRAGMYMYACTRKM